MLKIMALNPKIEDFSTVSAYEANKCVLLSLFYKRKCMFSGIPKYL